MNAKFFAAAALGAAASLAFGAAANAQAQAQGYSLTGNASGICVLNGGQMVSDSAVGKAVAARLQQLGAQVASELNPEGQAIENEGKAIEAAAKTATTPAAQQPLQTRANALNTRLNNFQQKRQLRAAELQATEQKALARINTEALPIVRQVAAQKSCAVVLNAVAVYEANPAMDITPAAITALNGKITTFSFERENLAARAAAPQK